jgi:hypothetical protein
MFDCLICSGKSFSTKHLLAQHCKGKSHKHNADVGVAISESEQAAQQEALHAFKCSVCPETSFDSELALNRHCKGKRHLEISTGKRAESASSESLTFSCLFCLGASFKTQDGLKQHCEGKKHLEIAAGNLNDTDAGAPSFNCTICPGSSFDSQRGLTQHCQGKRHLENVDPSGKSKESDAAGHEVIVQR